MWVEHQQTSSEDAGMLITIKNFTSNYLHMLHLGK